MPHQSTQQRMRAFIENVDINVSESATKLPEIHASNSNKSQRPCSFQYGVIVCILCAVVQNVYIIIILDLCNMVYIHLCMAHINGFAANARTLKISSMTPVDSNIA